METQGPALIAIVDDEESVRAALLRLLRLEEFRVETFSSATAFLNASTDFPPDCVVLDLNMPGMTGVELLQHFSVLDDPPPVIVITAEHQQTIRDKCRALGVKHYLIKPVDRKALLDSIRDVV
jgi:FixJ family two-component response regulator